MKSGEILTELLKQGPDSPVPMEALVLILYAYNKKMLHELTVEEVNKFQAEAYHYCRKKNDEVFVKLREKRDADDEMKKEFDKLIAEYIKLEIISKRPKEDLDDDEDGAAANVGVDVLDKATSKKKEEAKK